MNVVSDATRKNAELIGRSIINGKHSNGRARNTCCLRVKTMLHESKCGHASEIISDLVELQSRLVYRQTRSTLSNAATLFSDTLPGCHTLSQLTRLHTVKSSCHSADYPTRRGSVVQVAPTSDGWTRFATTTTVHPLIVERCSRRGHSRATQRCSPT